MDARKDLAEGQRKTRFTLIRWVPLLDLALFCAAVVSLIVYLWVVFNRIRYPFDLEWIEGGMVDQVQRLLHGQSMYVAPSIYYVPFLYPPLFFYLSALASLIVGSGQFALRLVSFLASLVTFSVIFIIVREETRDWKVALLSIGLFAAAYRITGAWLDVARVDSLFLALWMLFVYFVRSRNGVISALLAGLFAALAYLTKQTALIACIPILIFLFWRNWKQALAFLAAAGLIIGAVTLLEDRASAGWYSYYVFGLLSQQTQWLYLEFITFWNDDLLVHVPIAILFIIFLFAGRLRQDRLRLLQWLSILAGALLGTFVTRVKIGGYDNVLLPAYAVIAIFFGLGLKELLTFIRQVQFEYRNKLEGLVLGACLIQFVMLAYNPIAQIPSESDLQAGQQLLGMLASVKGEIFLPDHGYIPTLAGKMTYAHESAIWDVLRGNAQTPGKTILSHELQEAIQQQKFDEIILDSDLDLQWCCKNISQSYSLVGQVFQDSTSFYTMTGDRKRPTYIYIADRLGAASPIH